MNIHQIIIFLYKISIIVSFSICFCFNIYFMYFVMSKFKFSPKQKLTWFITTSVFTIKDFLISLVPVFNALNAISRVIALPKLDIATSDPDVLNIIRKHDKK